MLKRLFSIFFAAILAVGVSLPASFADQGVIGDNIIAEINFLKEKLSEVDAMKARIVELENQLTEQKRYVIEQSGSVREVREALIKSVPSEGLIKYAPGEGIELPYGFKIQAGATMVVQGTPNANNAGDDQNKSRCDGSWSADIFIEKSFDDWGLALIHLEPGQSDGLEGQLSLFSNVNRDANPTDSLVPITEVWYEHYLFDKQIAITAGKMDPANYLDQNEYAFDETTQFLNRLFRNSSAIEWPDDNTIGAQIALAPDFIPYLAFNAAYFNANNSYEDIFDKPFISTQITFMPAKAFGYDEDMWGGNYRAYFWYNGLEHYKYVNLDESDPDDVKEKNYGFGLSFDQKVTDIFGLFARFGWQRPDVAIAGANPSTAPVEASWSSGIQMTGKYWNREDDVLAFAIGQNLPSKNYKDAGNGGAAEGHFEAYYNVKITKNLSITPDFQWIWNPNGCSEPYQGYDKNIFVYGVRAQVNF